MAGSDLETIPDCIGCRNEHAELGEYLKSQKIAHRLEYIKQQLINNLHVQSVPIETPKFDSLPDFLVQKLVYEDTSNKASDSFADGTNDEPPNRQMVLFVEEGTTISIIYQFNPRLFFIIFLKKFQSSNNFSFKNS